ncbi:uncharacterized protein LOC118700383 isoform X2 [Molothrus ater]|uniref:uncharacterized protein LOC118700383 isoform X2 n=1 Tax=Molothrus ater TaxID=84834 RepID=UPI00174948AC|nr:uncharacterized protein LOC118700383 isoform X2 [Molothrus ater]
MNSGGRRGSRGDFGAGVGARSPWREGREEFLLFEEHHHCQQQPKPPAGCQELPGVFLGCTKSCSVGLLSVLTQHSPPCLSPSIPQVLNTQIPSESPPAWNAAWRRTGKQPRPGVGAIPPSHSKSRSSCGDLSDLQGAQRLPWSSRAEGAQCGLGRMFWKGSRGGVWGGLGGSCSLLVVEHKTLAGSLQVTEVCGGPWCHLWCLWQRWRAGSEFVNSRFCLLEWHFPQIPPLTQCPCHSQGGWRRIPPVPAWGGRGAPRAWQGQDGPSWCPQLWGDPNPTVGPGLQLWLILTHREGGGAGIPSLEGQGMPFPRKFLFPGDSFSQRIPSPGDSFSQGIPFPTKFLFPGNSSPRKFLSQGIPFLGNSFSRKFLVPGDSFPRKFLVPEISFS